MPPRDVENPPRSPRNEENDSFEGKRYQKNRINRQQLREVKRSSLPEGAPEPELLLPVGEPTTPKIASVEIASPTAKEETSYPAELVEIYGAKIPPANVIEMLSKLKSAEKRQSYLDMLRASLQEKPKTNETRTFKKKEIRTNSHKTRQEVTPDRDQNLQETAVAEKVEEFKSIEQRNEIMESYKQPETLKEPEEVAPRVEIEVTPQLDPIQRLRNEIKDLETEAKKPNARKEIESDILGREAELRTLETARNSSAKNEANTLRMKEVRERIARLEYEAARPAEFRHKSDELETEVLALEDELRGLERKTKSETTPSKSVSTEAGASPVVESNSKETDFGFSSSGLSGVEVPVNMAAENAALAATAGEQEGMFANPEDAPDHIKRAAENEGTPKEWRDKLRGLIESAKEKVGLKSESGERLQGYLGGRLKALDEMLNVESRFRSMGEKYNKLNFLQKLGIGLSLGVGAAAFTTVSMPVVYACLAGIGVQRVYGFASSFLHFEKEVQENLVVASFGKFGHLKVKEGKEKQAALASAFGYSMLAGMAIREAIDFASETETAHAVQRWLGDKLGHHLAHHGVSGKIIEAPHSAIAPETPATGISPEITAIKIPASSHGYEGMLKQLWSQLQEKHIELPATIDQKSDLYTLLHADKDSIDGVVHRLAMDSNHAFFQGDMSAHIDSTAHLSIGTDGQLHFGDAGHSDIVHAAQDMFAAPEVTHTPVVESVTPIETSASSDTSALNSDVFLGTSPTDATPQVFVHEAVPVSTGGAEGYLVDSSGQNVVDSQGNPVHSGSYEGTVHAEATTPDITINQFGHEISKLEPHVYADSSKHLFVFGGSVKEQADTIKEYLTANPGSTIIGTDNSGTYRIPFHLENGEVTPGEPVRNTGFLSFFSSTFMKAPSPDEFKDVIK